MTWFVMCPQWKSSPDHANGTDGWSLSRKEIEKIGNRYFVPLIDCTTCGNKFSLQEGLKEAFSCDEPYVIHFFRSNTFEKGTVEIQLGQKETVKFASSFDNPPEVYLTPHRKPAFVAPAYLTKEQFIILSDDSGTGDKTRRIGWGAFGNRKHHVVPLWRELLASSKAHQFRKDFRQEIVDLHTAFEVFASEYIRKSLSLDGKLNNELVNWISNLRTGGLLEVGFIALKGKPLKELEKKAFKTWRIKVNELRNDVVHRGLPVSDHQAREAREATFELITRIDDNTINHFALLV